MDYNCLETNDLRDVQEYFQLCKKTYKEVYQMDLKYEDFISNSKRILVVKENQKVVGGAMLSSVDDNDRLPMESKKFSLAGGINLKELGNYVEVGRFVADGMHRSGAVTNCIYEKLHHVFLSTGINTVFLLTSKYMARLHHRALKKINSLKACGHGFEVVKGVNVPDSTKAIYNYQVNTVSKITVDLNSSSSLKSLRAIMKV